MPQPSIVRPPLSDRPPAHRGPPSVLTDDLDGPLCALSLYLSAAERALRATDIDRDRLGQALQGAREQLTELARMTAAACETRR